MSTAFGPGNAEIHGEAVALVPAGNRTATGSGGTVVAGVHDAARLSLNVTAASGTSPSLTVTVQHSADGATWVNHTSFTAVAGPTTERRVLSGIDRFIRATWTITGTTPSFAFSLTGELV